MTDTWDGKERRATNDDLRLEAALTDVRALKGVVAQLAEALTIKSETLHKVMVRMTILFIVLFVGQMLSSWFWVTGINRHMDDGHTRISCEHNLTPEQRAALGELACK